MSKLCECGCGGEVSHPSNRFIKGHQFKTPIIKEPNDFDGFDWYEIKDYNVWNQKKHMFYFVFCKDVVKLLTSILIELKKLNGGTKDGN